MESCCIDLFSFKNNSHTNNGLKSRLDVRDNRKYKKVVRAFDDNAGHFSLPVVRLELWMTMLVIFLC